MNRRTVELAVGIGAILCVWCRPAAAEPIAITGGYVQLSGATGSVALTGTRDFSLAANISISDGVFMPSAQCNIGPGCLPGSLVSLDGTWLGSSLRDATATLDGQSYSNVGGLTSTTSASLRLTGSAVLPPFESDAVSIMAPFVFEGLFSYPSATGSGINLESLFGAGTVTLSLRRVFGGESGLPAAWAYTSARYDFAPTPEPATLLLTGAGIAVMALRKLKAKPFNF
jgi:hypothetical protein